MKSVGIKLLKNQISKYLKLVQDGETVLVTDRDEVIAEIHRPTIRAVSELSEWDAVLNRLSREGIVRRAKRRQSRVARELKSNPLPPAGVEALAILTELREDRS